MYWWNVSKLAEDLRESRVGEKERFTYFLATITLWMFASQLFFRFGDPFKTEYLIASGVNLVLVIVGTAFCYRANKNGDNVDFIPRMICLGWPIGLLVLLIVSAIFLFVSLLVSLLSAAFGLAPFLAKIMELAANFQSSLPESGLAFGLTLIPVYCLSLHRYLTRASQPKEVVSAPETNKIERTLAEQPAVLLAILGVAGALVAADQITMWSHNLRLPKLLDFYVGTLASWAFLVALLFPLTWIEKRWKLKSRAQA